MIKLGMSEGRYGGAFDLEDNTIWTKDELVEFAQDCEDTLNDTKTGKFRYTDVYIGDDDRTIFIEFEDEDGNVYETSTKVDMRSMSGMNIPKKYNRDIIGQVTEQFEEYTNY